MARASLARRRDAFQQDRGKKASKAPRHIYNII
jgi:hypothetical protein